MCFKIEVNKNKTLHIYFEIYRKKWVRKYVFENLSKKNSYMKTTRRRRFFWFWHTKLLAPKKLRNENRR